jgi:hypothetical protein
MLHRIASSLLLPSFAHDLFYLRALKAHLLGSEPVPGKLNDWIYLAAVEAHLLCPEPVLGKL